MPTIGIKPWFPLLLQLPLLLLAAVLLIIPVVLPVFTPIFAPGISHDEVIIAAGETDIVSVTAREYSAT